MAVFCFAAPILPGKVEAVKRFAAELSGPRSKEFAEAQRRAGVSREVVWVQETPQGAMAVVYLDVDDPARAFKQMGSSDTPFDRWYAEQVKEIHGIDLTQPFTLSQVAFEWRAS
ncbi:MAG: hypothetical protein HYX88_04235 [Chloroflexi bacterium]|nr:hypothetical protein [Chloroflexota bacterium]